MNSSLSRTILLLLVLACLVFPCLTWILSAFDLPVRSLLSDEGLRWLFHNGSASLVAYPIEVVILFLVSLGALRFVGFFSRPWQHSTAWYASLLFLLLLSLFLAYAAFSVHSPLVSITGTLRPSPFLDGLPAAVCLALLATALLYGLLSARLKHLSDMAGFFLYGISQYAPWLLSAMLLSFLVSCFRFAFRI